MADGIVISQYSSWLDSDGMDETTGYDETTTYDVALDSSGFLDNWIAAHGTSYNPSGYRLSPVFDLSNIGIADGTTAISWTGVTPSGTSVVVEINLSLDNGESWLGWQAVTSGGAIPGIVASTDLSDALLQTRVTLVTTDPTHTYQLDDITLRIGQVGSGITPVFTQIRVTPAGVGKWQVEHKVYATTWTPTARVADVMTIPTRNIFAKSNWSVELDFTPNSNPVSGAVHYLFSCQVDSNNRYQLWVSSSGEPRLVIYSGGVAKSIATSLIMAVGSTYSIFASGDGINIVFAVNGVQYGGSTAYTEPVGTLPANLYIGSDSSGTNQPNGIVGNVRIGRARTMAEHIAAYAIALGHIWPVDADTTALMPAQGALTAYTKRLVAQI